jgi:hypothetical protein
MHSGGDICKGECREELSRQNEYYKGQHHKAELRHRDCQWNASNLANGLVSKSFNNRKVGRLFDREQRLKF